MALFGDTVGAFLAAREWDAATISRLSFWVEAFGNRELADISPDEVDAAIARLVQRGSLNTGKPLTGSTINRYVAQLGSIFKYARKSRLLPRAFVAPTQGIEREREEADPERYFRPEEFARVLASARVHDRVWRKMPALVTVAYHTGLRVGSLLAVRGRNLDLKAGTITIVRSKNGDPVTSALSTAAAEELKRLPRVGPDELVFGNKAGKRFHYRSLWLKIADRAGLAGRVFHELRHGHGYALARAGTSQPLIMQSMGHRTLTASARYVHSNVEDKRAVVARVFG